MILDNLGDVGSIESEEDEDLWDPALFECHPHCCQSDRCNVNHSNAVYDIPKEALSRFSKI